MDATAPEGATTVLSPYLHFGALSARTFYWALEEATRRTKTKSEPPVSLTGQLLWREFFHLVGRWTPHFDQMQVNVHSALTHIPALLIVY